MSLDLNLRDRQVRMQLNLPFRPHESDFRPLPGDIRRTVDDLLGDVRDLLTEAAELFAPYEGAEDPLDAMPLASQSRADRLRRRLRVTCRSLLSTAREPERVEVAHPRLLGLALRAPDPYYAHAISETVGTTGYPSPGLVDLCADLRDELALATLSAHPHLSKAGAFQIAARARHPMTLVPLACRATSGSKLARRLRRQIYACSKMTESDADARLCVLGMVALDYDGTVDSPAHEYLARYGLEEDSWGEAFEMPLRDAPRAEANGAHHPLDPPAPVEGEAALQAV